MVMILRFFKKNVDRPSATQFTCLNRDSLKELK